MKYKTKLTVCFLSMILLIALDQITKIIAVNQLKGKGEIPILGDFFILVFAQNRGGFLSVGHETGQFFWLLFFVIIPIIVLAAASFYMIQKKIDINLYLIIWVLLISGGVGNIIDRVLFGKVTDFMNAGIGSLRTGIFNFADLYITVVPIIVFIIYWIMQGNKGEQKTDESSG